MRWVSGVLLRDIRVGQVISNWQGAGSNLRTWANDTPRYEVSEITPDGRVFATELRVSREKCWMGRITDTDITFTVEGAYANSESAGRLRALLESLL